MFDRSRLAFDSRAGSDVQRLDLLRGKGALFEPVPGRQACIVHFAVFGVHKAVAAGAESLIFVAVIPVFQHCNSASLVLKARICIELCVEALRDPVPQPDAHFFHAVEIQVELIVVVCSIDADLSKVQHAVVDVTDARMIILHRLRGPQQVGIILVVVKYRRIVDPDIETIALRQFYDRPESFHILRDQTGIAFRWC